MLSGSTRLIRITALICVAALLSSATAFAAPVPGSGDTTRSADATAPSASQSTTTSANGSNDASSAVDVEVDEETRKFRAELAKRQERLQALKEKLAQLDQELSIAVEEYDRSAYRLLETKTRLEANQQDLAAAQQAYELQVRLFGDRAAAIYRDGGTNPVEVLLSAKSLPDLVSRMSFLGMIGERDAEAVEQIAGQRDQIRQAATDLETAKAEAEALEFSMRARKIEIENRVMDQQQLMATAEADLLELLDEEASRRNADEDALYKSILAGMNQAGVVVQPGSPVETALAYHGVPYLWAGDTPAAFDCSGLILYVFRQHGVELPHYSGAQFQLGVKVEPWDLQANDVVFFGSPVHHVGLYLGGGYYLHAPKTGDFVKVSRLADRNDFAGARRYGWTPRVAPIAGLDQLDRGRMNTSVSALPQ